MSLVSVRDLTKTYPGPPPVGALRGVDLDLVAGTLTAVLGPSGCGKTTLLRVLAGLERADAGRVRIGELVVADGRSHLAPERRGVGIVPQEGALFPHLDVGSNLAYGIRRLPRAERDERVRKLLELVGLAGFERRRPHELSGGQQQRVALARALAREPSVILLDEPFSALDASLRSSLRDQVLEVLHRTSTTALLVTHDQEEALSLADQVAVMRDGAIVQCGSPTELYRRPVDVWTARFVGDAVVVPGQRSASRDERVETVLGALALDPATVDPTDLDSTALDPTASASDREVLVLIRPEQIVRSDATCGAVPASVEQVRFRGTFGDVTLRIGEVTLAARWPSTALPEVGAEVSVAVAGPVVAFPADG